MPFLRNLLTRWRAPETDDPRPSPEERAMAAAHREARNVAHREAVYDAKTRHAMRVATICADALRGAGTKPTAEDIVAFAEVVFPPATENPPRFLPGERIQP